MHKRVWENQAKFPFLLSSTLHSLHFTFYGNIIFEIFHSWNICLDYIAEKCSYERIMNECTHGNNLVFIFTFWTFECFIFRRCRRKGNSNSNLEIFHWDFNKRTCNFRKKDYSISNNFVNLTGFLGSFRNCYCCSNTYLVYNWGKSYNRYVFV